MASKVRFSLRPAVFQDSEAVLTLAERVSDFEPPPWRTRREIGEGDFPEVTSYLREMPEDADLTIAYSEDCAAAGIVLTRLEKDFFTGALTAHLSVIAVAEECVGQGLGSQLLRHAEDWAK
jgi:GNAT superfamily N-acetyltransferase